LENNLNNIIIGQREIIKSIVRDIKIIRLGYKEDNKPRSYLFVGPTGVGKTLLAKELNKFLTNNDDIIRLDMSEYKEPYSISKIIGSPPGYVGYSNKTTILDQIKIKHNSIILLDEIEKSCPEVINLFLQALDEGYIKNSNNEEIRLDNNIIIITSNIGYKNNAIGFNNKNDDKVKRNIKDLLGIEFVNRIDKVFLFNYLNYNNIKKIVLDKIADMMKLFDLKESNFKLKNEVIEQIIELSEYKEFGARKVDKIIKDKLYDKIIDEKINKNVNITIETI
jgi:ATP-dependent Clp protease ATP-binding subunit ClpA